MLSKKGGSWLTKGEEQVHNDLVMKSLLAKNADIHLAMFTISQHGMAWLLGSVACSDHRQLPFFRPAPVK
jgi:hypothetical protein